MLIVGAVGGNALLRRGERSDPDVQSHNASLAATVLAPLAHGNSLVITHGNGPQVGLLALESGLSGVSPRYPLGVVGAESPGMIGYLLELALRNQLPGRAMATILGQVLVDTGDPAFDNPTRPIGPFHGESEARVLGKTNRVAAGSGPLTFWEEAS